jgi:hypothetical protein
MKLDLFQTLINRNFAKKKDFCVKMFRNRQYFGSLNNFFRIRIRNSYEVFCCSGEGWLSW